MCAAVSSDLMTLEYLQRIDQGLEEGFMEDDEYDANDFTNTDHDNDDDNNADNDNNNTSTNTDTEDAIAAPPRCVQSISWRLIAIILTNPFSRNDNNQMHFFLRVPKSSSSEKFDRNMRRTSFFDNLLGSLPADSNKDKAVEWLLKYIGKKNDVTFAKVCKDLTDVFKALDDCYSILCMPCCGVPTNADYTRLDIAVEEVDKFWRALGLNFTPKFHA